MSVPPLPRLATTLPATTPQSFRPSYLGRDPRFARTSAWSKDPPLTDARHRSFGLSSARMLPIRTVWRQFLDLCEVFCRNCQLDAAHSSFMSQVTVLSKRFDIFSKFAVIIFNSIHPEGDPRARLTTTAVTQSARSVSAEWAEFARNFNVVVREGLQPLFPLLVKQLEKLGVALDKVADLFLVGTLKTALSTRMMNRIDELMRTLHDMADEQQYPESQPFDLEKCKAIVAELTELMKSIFKRAMPRYRMSSGEVMLEKMNLNIALNELIDFVEGMQRFDDLAEEMRTTMKALNDEFTRTFHALGCPVTLTMTVGEDKEVTIEENGIRPVMPLPPKVPATARAPRCTFACAEGTI